MMITKQEASIEEGKKKAVKTVGKELAIRVLEVVDQGLCGGLGKPIPGQMCVEAAVCYAMGDDHDDSPSCVSDDIVGLKVLLNDKKWPSRKARADGMRRIAVAQLGSTHVLQGEFSVAFMNALLKNVVIPILKQHKKYADTVKQLSGKEPDMNALRTTNISSLKNLYNEYYTYFSSTPKYFLTPSMNFAKEFGKMKLHDSLKLHCLCVEEALVKCKTKGSKYLYLCNDNKEK